MGAAALALGPHIYMAVYGGEIVVLDAQAEKYLGIGPSVSRAVMWALAPDLLPEPRNADAALAPVVQRGLLVTATGRAKHHRLIGPREPGGLADPAWRPLQSPYLHGRDWHATAPGTVSALARLRQADRTLRSGGISRLLASLQARCCTLSQRASTPIESQEKALSRLINAHITARMLYPRRIDCLPGAAALALDAWHRMIPVRFVIGVQKYPFHAHAWVQLGDTVVNDAQDVRNRLAPIVMIPSLACGTETATRLI